jgi:hypothetical protein
MPEVVLTLAIICHVHFVGTAFFFSPKAHWQVQAYGKSIKDLEHASTRFSFPGLLSSLDSTERSNGSQNRIYVEGLMSNLGTLCDKYIMNGSPKIRERVFNVLDQIAVQAMDEDMIRQSIRMVKRAGVPMHMTYLEKFQKDERILGKTDAEERRQEALRRKEWEQQNYRINQQQPQQESRLQNSSVDTKQESISSSNGKSALSQRVAWRDGKPDLFTPTILDPDAIATIANDKNALQKELQNGNLQPFNGDNNSFTVSVEAASARVSEMIARAGSGNAFDGQTLGVGGLDDVLVEIKRRIWTPLAAPPQLLKGIEIENGINLSQTPQKLAYLFVFRFCFRTRDSSCARATFVWKARKVHPSLSAPF